MTKFDDPNIVLIIMDTARFDTVSQSILEEVMSNLSRLADEGTVFTDCYANGPWTLPSHGSLFTGQYASDHGAHAGTKRFNPTVSTLAERLREQGYRTGGYSNNTWISPEFGFDRGFEDFMVRWELTSSGKDPSALVKASSTRERLQVLRKLIGKDLPQTIFNTLYATYLFYANTEDDGARRTTDRLIDWTDRDDGRPFFLFANYTEPHLEYDPPDRYRYRYVPEGLLQSDLDSAPQDPWGYITGSVEMTDRDFEALSALYLAELDYLDDQLGRLFGSLRNRGVLDETAVFVLGDHGENIGDHGLMDHQYSIRESLIHVPLLCRYPPVFPEGECESLIEIRDLYPIISSLAGSGLEEVPSSVSRMNLDIVQDHVAGRDYTIAEYLEPQPSMETLRNKVGRVGAAKQYDRALRSLRTDRWSYIESSDGDERLYDREADPRERTDVSNDETEVLAELRETLADDRGELVRNPGEERSVSGRTKRRLENMGYLQ